MIESQPPATGGAATMLVPQGVAGAHVRSPRTPLPGVCREAAMAVRVVDVGAPRQRGVLQRRTRGHGRTSPEYSSTRLTRVVHLTSILRRRA